MNRQRDLHKLRSMLTSPSADLLMDDLKAKFDPTEFDPSNPTTLAYQAGMRDAYRYIEALATGEFINE